MRFVGRAQLADRRTGSPVRRPVADAVVAQPARAAPHGPLEMPEQPPPGDGVDRPGRRRGHVALEGRDRVARPRSVGAADGQPGLAFVVEQPLQGTDGVAAAADREVRRECTPGRVVHHARRGQATSLLMCDDRGPRRAAELARDGQVAAGGAEQVLQRSDIRPTIADALDRVVGRQGRDLTRQREQQEQRSARNGRQQGGARGGERVHASGGLEYASTRPAPNPADRPATWRLPDGSPRRCRRAPRRSARRPADARRQPARPAPAQPVVGWRRVEPLGRQPAARRDRRAVDADRCRHRRRRHPGCAAGRFRVAGTAPRGHGRRQPGRGAQRGARCPPEAGSHPAPAAGPRRPGAPAVPERDVRRRACVAGRASPRRGRGRPLSRGARPCQPARDRRQRSAPRPPRIARGVARRPVPHPEPLHASTIRCCPSGGPGRSRRSRGCCAGPGWSRSIAARPRSGSATRWSRSRQPPRFPRPPSRDGTGRRDRRRRAGRGDRRVAAGPRRPRRHRVRAKPGIPLASLRRVRVARHGRRAPPHRPR